MLAQLLPGVDQASLDGGRCAVGDMVGRVVAVGEVDAVEALVARTVGPALDGASTDVEALGDGALGLPAAEGGDDITAAGEVRLFLLIAGLSEVGRRA